MNYIYGEEMYSLLMLRK